MQPVGSTQRNARAQVDLPVSLMLINTHALVDVGQRILVPRALVSFGHVVSETKGSGSSHNRMS